MDTLPIRAGPTLRGQTILLMITRLGRGGAQKQLVHLARGLRDRGAAVHVVSLMERPGPWEAELARSCIDVHVLGEAGRAGPGAILVVRARRLIRALQPGVVVSFCYHANVVARVVAPATDGRILISSIRNERFGPPGRERLMRILDRRATISTTNSRAAAQYLIRRGVMPPGRLVVVPNAIDVGKERVSASERARIRHDMGVTDGVFVWLAAGRLEAQKGLDQLLTAARRVAIATDHPFALWVAGDGPLRRQLERRASALGIGALCRFLGHRSDLPSLMGSADALAHPSLWEGMPNVVMEAMASGLPVVATDAGGVREVVADGRTGRIVPLGQTDSFSQAMLDLMACPVHDRRVMGRAARERMLADHDVDRVVDQWIDVIDGRAPRPGGGSPENARPEREGLRQVAVGLRRSVR